MKALNEKHTELVLELNKLNAKLQESPNSKKTKSKINQLKQQVDSNTRKINETKELMQTEGMF